MCLHSCRAQHSTPVGQRLYPSNLLVDGKADASRRKRSGATSGAAKRHRRAMPGLAAVSCPTAASASATRRQPMPCAMTSRPTWSGEEVKV